MSKYTDRFGESSDARDYFGRPYPKRVVRDPDGRPATLATFREWQARQNRDVCPRCGWPLIDVALNAKGCSRLDKLGSH